MFNDMITLEELNKLEYCTKTLRNFSIAIVIYLTIINCGLAYVTVTFTNWLTAIALIFTLILTVVIAYIALLQVIEYEKIKEYKKTYKIEL